MNNVTNIKNHNLLVFDIETTSLVESFSDLEDLNPELASEYNKRFSKDVTTTIDDHFAGNAALYPEYNKVICCSFTTVKFDGNLDEFKINSKSFKDHDEVTLLNKINKVFGTSGWLLAGMNIGAFDIPVLIKRMVINGVKPSSTLINIAFNKPWLKEMVDLGEIWKFGAFGGGATLGAICATLGVETPKGGVYGPLVPKFYWTGMCEEIYGSELIHRDEALTIIDEYCMKDTISTAKCLIRLNEILF